MQGLRGLVAQGMSGRKGNLPQYPVPQMVDTTVSGPAVFTANYAGILSIYVWGAGGSGLSSNGGGTSGGGGGGAVFKRIRIAPNQRVAYTVGAGGAAVLLGNGNSGADSTVTLPSGQILTAGGGKGGGVSANAGGIGAGGDVNSNGGAGGAGPSAGGNGDNGGGTGGPVAAPDSSGGGGVAGLASVTTGLANTALWGNGGTNGGAGSLPGSGGAGTDLNTTAGAGGNGRVLMILERYAAKP